MKIDITLRDTTTVTLTVKPTDNSDSSEGLFDRVRNTLIRKESLFHTGTTLEVSLPPETFLNTIRQIKVAIEDAKTSIGIPIKEVVYEHQQGLTITPENSPRHILSAQQ